LNSSLDSYDLKGV